MCLVVHGARPRRRVLGLSAQNLKPSHLSAAQELRDYTFDWRYMVRGLTIDKVRGNVLKIDRHKYVKIAYHGFREMDAQQRDSTYGYSNVRYLFFGMSGLPLNPPS